MLDRAFRTTLLIVGALALAACSGGDADTEAPAAAASAASAAAPATSATAPAASSDSAVPVYDFATGPAVLVSSDFEPSTERVDSTGAYLPANGKPTLVFVDAIW